MDATLSTWVSRVAASDGHGFSSWLFIALLVDRDVAALCVTVYVLVLVRGKVGRRR